MPRRSIHVVDIDSFPSSEPSPLDWMIANEAARTEQRVPTVLLGGCGAWPLPGQSREPSGPQVEPPARAREKSDPIPCGGCGGVVREGQYCLVCDRPRGSMVAKARAAVARRAFRPGTAKGGVGRRAG